MSSHLQGSRSSSLWKGFYVPQIFSCCRSGHRKRRLGRPDQRDLSENLAATQGLAFMITEVQRLFQVHLQAGATRTANHVPLRTPVSAHRFQSSGRVRVLVRKSPEKVRFFRTEATRSEKRRSVV